MMIFFIRREDLEAKDEEGDSDDALSGNKNTKTRLGSQRREASSKLLQTDLQRLQSKSPSSLHLNKVAAAQSLSNLTPFLIKFYDIKIHYRVFESPSGSLIMR